MENKGNSLAKIAIGLNVVLIIAVIILFVKMPAGDGENVTSNDEANDSLKTNNTVDLSGAPRICYFQGDSVQTLDMMAEMEGLMKQAQEDANRKMQQKDAEIKRWQDSWGDPSKLLPSELQKFQQEAMAKEQEYGAFQQQLQMELASSQEDIMFKLVTRVSDASKRYAEENGFDYVLSYQLGQNVYYAAPKYDVTEELMKMINDEYHSNQTATDGPAVNDPTVSDAEGE
jgi:outer membrane protein